MKKIWGWQFWIGLPLVFLLSACGSANKVDEQIQETAMGTQSELYEHNAEMSVDDWIEKKINDAGALTFTEDEFSKERVSRAIERRIPFQITHLSNRDEMIKKMKKILKDNQQSYKVVKEKKAGLWDAVVGVIDGATLGGAAATGGSAVLGYAGATVGAAAVAGAAPIVASVGAVAGLGYVAKDYIFGLFSSKKDWLISKSPDKTILHIIFVKNQD